MKILHIHNRYIETGGEDHVVNEQIELLKEQGHSIIEYRRNNKELKEYGFYNKIKFLLKDVLWSSKSYLEVQASLREHQPDIAVVHNIFYLITPSIYQACHEEGVPVIQYFHSYRWLLHCAKRNIFPEFKPASLKSLVLSCFCAPRILKKIVKERIFEDKVQSFVCLSNFSKKIFVDHGFKEERISVIPPYVELSDVKREGVGQYALFVGRLADYKGIRVLLSAMRKLKMV